MTEAVRRAIEHSQSTEPEGFTGSREVLRRVPRSGLRSLGEGRAGYADIGELMRPRGRAQPLREAC